MTTHLVDLNLDLITETNRFAMNMLAINPDWRIIHRDSYTLALVSPWDRSNLCLHDIYYEMRSVLEACTIDVKEGHRFCYGPWNEYDNGYYGAIFWVGRG